MNGWSKGAVNADESPAHGDAPRLFQGWHWRSRRIASGFMTFETPENAGGMHHEGQEEQLRSPSDQQHHEIRTERPMPYRSKGHAPRGTAHAPMRASSVTFHLQMRGYCDRSAPESAFNNAQIPPFLTLCDGPKRTLARRQRRQHPQQLSLEASPRSLSAPRQCITVHRVTHK